MDARDEALIEAYRAGERAAGEALVDRYYPRILAFFRNKVPSSARDLAQHTFAETFEVLSRLRDPAGFRCFLFAIARNHLYKYLRKRHREPIDFDSVSGIDLDPSPSGVVAAREQQRLLLEGLRRIPLDYQSILELFYWEGMTAVEIGEVMGLPTGTVKTKLRRGRELLREVIAALGGSGDARSLTAQSLDGWARQARAHVLGQDQARGA